MKAIVQSIYGSADVLAFTDIETPLAGRAYTKHGSFDAAVPISLQLGLSAMLGPLAEALGYRAVYDRYLR